MNRKPMNRPSFFKVLISKDFSHLLRLPPTFLQKYGSLLSENITIRISSGNTWNVKLEQMENSLFCFTQGWEKFAQDVGLKFGEFLVFRIDHKSIFDVSIYETSACEREFPGLSFQVEDSDPDEDHAELSEDKCNTKSHSARDVLKRKQSKAENNGGPTKFDQSVKESSPLYFEIRLKSHHRSRVDIPKRFAVDTGIAINRKVKLEDAKGRKWPINVTDRNIGSYSLTAGWNEFLLGNNVVIGSIILFQFIPSSNNVIKTLVLKNGKGKNF